MWGGNASSGNSAAKDDVEIGNSDIRKNGFKIARNTIDSLPEFNRLLAWVFSEFMQKHFVRMNYLYEEKQQTTMKISVSTKAD